MSDDFLSAAVGAIEGFRDVYVPRKNLEFEMDLRSKYKDRENARELELYKQKLPIQIAAERSNEVFKSNLTLDREKQLLPIRAEAGIEKFKQELPLRTDAAIKVGKAVNDAKTEQKMELKKPEAQASVKDSISNLTRMENEASALLSDPNLSKATGLSSLVAPKIPGTKAFGVGAKIRTLKSQIGFGVLQAMRNASKTGGALGNVSDKEIETLQNNLAALEEGQSPEDFKKNLQQVINYSKEAKTRIQSAYRDTYGDEIAESQELYNPDDVLKSLPAGSEFLGFE